MCQLGKLLSIILLLKNLFYMKIATVKKTVLIFVLSLVVLSMVPALDWKMDIALGLPSYVGLNCKKGRFEFNLGINTSAGLGGILSYSLMDKYISTDTTANMTPYEKFSYGNKLIHGLSLGIYYDVFDTPSFDLFIGSDITALHVSSKEGVISHFTKGDIVLFNINAKASFNLNRSSIFIKAGFPLFAYINYGGDNSSANYLPFDFWAFIPTAVKEVEEGNYIDVTALQLSLLFLALDFKIGYSISF